MKKILKIKINLDKISGATHRNKYLEENPHGFKRVKKIHESKKKYSRKRKKDIC